MATFPNPFLTEGGTIYQLCEGSAGDKVYELWGSGSPEHQWLVVGTPERWEAKNSKTGVTKKTPPEVPEAQRPRKMDAVLKRMVEAFYQMYKPAKVGDAASLLIHYAGKESTLLPDLFKTYDPTAWPLSYQLLQVYAEHAPDKLQLIPGFLKEYKGQEELLLKKLSELYNGGVPLPTPPPLDGGGGGGGGGGGSALRQQVMAFFDAHNPPKKADTDTIIAAYAGKEGTLMKDLHTSYNVPFADPAETLKVQVTEFFQKHNPPKVAEVDKILAAYAGKEDTLMRDLHTSYNVPFPDAQPASSAPATTGSDNVALKTQVTEFFQKHNPAKIAEIDTILNAYAGKEDTLMRDLHTSYNVPLQTGSVVAGTTNPYHAKVVAFYQTHNPAKVAEVATILAKYQGREEELMAELRKQYNVDDGDMKQKVTAFFEKHNPAKIPEVDKILAAYVGKEATLMRDLHTTYKVPYNDDSAFDIRQRVVNFFTKHNPDKLAEVDKILEMYSGRDRELMRDLHANYGVPYDDGSVPGSPVESAGGGGGGGGDLKKKVTEFFQKHNPVKLPEVDRILAAYAGKEDQLLPDLRTTYNVSDGAQEPAPAGTAVSALKKQVTEFFEKHNPPKVAEVDKILAAYAGKEDTLMRDLHTSYNVPLEETPSSPAPAASNNNSALKAQVTEFFQKHNPAKVAEIDTILAAYAGKEDTLMRDLHTSYNVPLPDAQPASSAPATTGSDNTALKTQVTEFFQKHNPPKVAEVDKILAAYAGKEDTLMRDLHTSYNVPLEETPSSPAPAVSNSNSALKAQVTVFFQKHNPAKVAEIDTILTAYAGKEDTLMRDLHTSYNVPLPDAQPASSAPATTGSDNTALKTQVTEFFQKHNPAKIAEIDTILTAYAGKEDTLMRDLRTSYNVPSEETPSSPAPAVSNNSALKTQVTEFFQKHNPAKVAEIDTILTAYAGKEDTLMRDLHTSYNVPFADAQPASSAPATTGSDNTALKTQVTEFFQKHNPPKVAEVDKILAAYAGKEDTLMRDLHTSYNVPLEETPSSPAPAVSNNSALKTQVTEFFQKHNPAKVAEIDTILTAYAGKEDTLMRDLHTSYNVPLAETPSSPAPAPAASSNSALKTQVTEFFQKHNPAKVAEIDTILTAYAEKEDTLMRDLHTSYNVPFPDAQPASSTPATTGSDNTALKTQVTEFFQKHNPAKVAEIDTILTAYAGKEDTLMRDLHTSYNVPLPDAQPASSAPTDNTALKQQVTEFFQKHNPAKIDDIDTIIAAYAGKEQTLLPDLHSSYSVSATPAPADSTTAPDALRQQVTEFFQKHNPPKVAEIDKILAAYAGKEDTLMPDLHASYNIPAESSVTTAPEDTLKNEVVAFFETHNPSKLPDVDTILASYADKRDTLMNDLHASYNVTTTTTTPDTTTIRNTATTFFQKHNPKMTATKIERIITVYKNRPDALEHDMHLSHNIPHSTAPTVTDLHKKVLRFFMEHNPDKIQDMATILASYAGRGSALLEDLHANYDVPMITAGASPVAEPDTALRAEVKAFFEKHNPAKCSELDVILASYRGKEAQLMQDLRAKYGVEEAPSTPIPTTPHSAASSERKMSTQKSVRLATADTKQARLQESLPTTLEIGTARYTMKTVKGETVYTRDDSPTQQWLVLADDTLQNVRYVTVADDLSHGWTEIPALTSSSSSADTRHAATTASPATVEQGTGTAPIAVQKDVSVCTATVQAERGVGADFLIASYDDVTALPQNARALAEELLEVKEEASRAHRAEKAAMTELTASRRKLSDLMGLIETRAKLADPQGAPAEELFRRMKKLSRDESVRKIRAQDTERVAHIHNTMFQSARDENASLSTELEASRSRERDLLAEIISLNKNLQEARNTQIASTEADISAAQEVAEQSAVTALQQTVHKKDGLIWGLSQELLGARWNDADRSDERGHTGPVLPNFEPPVPTAPGKLVITYEQSVQTTPEEGVPETMTQMTSVSPHRVREATPPPPPPPPSPPLPLTRQEDVDLVYETSSKWSQVAAVVDNGDVMDVVKTHWDVPETVLLEKLYAQKGEVYRGVMELEGATQQYYTQKLEQIYEGNEEQCAKIPLILSRYAGSEEEMMKKLQAKYGIPADTQPPPQQLRAHPLWRTVHTVLMEHDPDRLSHIDEVVRSGLDRPDGLLDNLSSQYGCGIKRQASLGCGPGPGAGGKSAAEEEEEAQRARHAQHSAQQLAAAQREIQDMQQKVADRDATAMHQSLRVEELTASLAKVRAAEVRDEVCCIQYAAVLCLVAAAEPAHTGRTQQGMVRSGGGFNRRSQGHGHGQSQQGHPGTAATATRWTSASPRRQARSRSRSPTPSSPSSLTPSVTYGEALKSFHRLKALNTMSKGLESLDRFA